MWSALLISSANTLVYISKRQGFLLKHNHNTIITLKMNTNPNKVQTLHKVDVSLTSLFISRFLLPISLSPLPLWCICWRNLFHKVSHSPDFADCIFLRCHLTCSSFSYISCKLLIKLRGLIRFSEQIFKLNTLWTFSISFNILLHVISMTTKLSKIRMYIISLAGPLVSFIWLF